jgi:hypothetical protein
MRGDCASHWAKGGAIASLQALTHTYPCTGQPFVLERVRSLVICGNQPYEWPDSPLARLVTDALAAAGRRGHHAALGARM